MGRGCRAQRRAEAARTRWGQAQRSSRAYGAVLLPLLLVAGWSCSEQEGTRTPGTDFLQAFEKGRYAEALAVVDKALATNAWDGVRLTYKGICLTKLD